MVLRADGRGSADGVGAIDLDLTANFSDWDEVADIQEPSNPRPLDPDELGGLVG